MRMPVLIIVIALVCTSCGERPPEVWHYLQEAGYQYEDAKRWAFIEEGKTARIAYERSEEGFRHGMMTLIRLNQAMEKRYGPSKDPFDNSKIPPCATEDVKCIMTYLLNGTAWFDHIDNYQHTGGRVLIGGVFNATEFTVIVTCHD